MKKRKDNYKYQSGFTLIELILYVGLASIILSVISAFLFYLLQGQERDQAISDVEQEGAQVMQIITQTIRNADSINNP
jgi:Tfp pilus assembly protein PilW